MDQAKKNKYSLSASELLSPVTAANLLGVTPELLFAYAVYPPKKAIGDGITLSYTSEGGHSGFLRGDLESFDRYLRQPWSEPGAPRPPLPAFIADYLKVECGGQCPRCGKGYKLENAHIVPYAKSRSHHHHNLIRLCVECHEMFETKRLISYDEIYELKQRLIAGIRDRLVVRVYPSGGLGRMPNPASQLVGREHELGLLIEALRNHRSISLEGPGGIGKTQLLLNGLRLSPDTRPVFWMSLEKYKDISDLQLALSAALSQPGSPVGSVSIVDALDTNAIRIAFDGVEQMSRADMDAVEDFFRNLLTMTSAPQFIFTSQAKMTNLDLEKRLELGPISEESSLLVLRPALSPVSQNVNEVEALCRLAEFCQGHPLSLQITSGLIQHFGSASVVLDRIHQSGGAAIENPTRRQQNTHTSLRACMLMSYQTLSASQRKVLWLVAQCPAGYCTSDKLELSGEYGIEDSVGDIAELRRWHLIDVDFDVPLWPHLYVLSPIRAFVSPEFQREAPDEIEDLEYLLFAELNIHAGILNEEFMQTGSAALGQVLFSVELPNFLYALRVSADRATERFLGLASLMASSLMAFCFTSGSTQLGIEIMQMGADAARQIGMKTNTSALLMNLIALAGRSSQIDAVRPAVAEMARLAEECSEPLLIANAENGRGWLAFMERRFDDAIEAFMAAILGYEEASRLLTFEINQAEDGEVDSLQDELKSVKQLLAMSLHGQGWVYERMTRPTEALHYHERALALVRELQDQINIGSFLHHIGNCAAEVKDEERALTSYVAAATQFQSIGMEEYLSNSLAEAGYLLVEWNPSSSIDDLFTAELIADGLLDTARQVERVFRLAILESPSNYGLGTLRKVFGLTALASFSSSDYLLADWAFTLQEEVLRPLLNQIDVRKPGMPGILLVMHLDLTLALARTLAAVEQSKAMGPYPEMAEVERYARLCYAYQEPGWAAFHPFEWLATYLHRHRRTKPLEPAQLRLAAEKAKRSGCEFFIDF